MAGSAIRRRSPGWRSRPTTSGPSAPTNLTLHQAIDINVPIGCGDAPVFPGDIVVGDADGCIVLPAHMAERAGGRGH